MRKGTTMLDNVRVLKWARHYDIRAGWNLLTGFPGERAENYDEQVDLIPLLTHLWPPTGVGRIWLERFSPYFFDDSFPVHDRRPEPAYRYIYPAGRVNLDKIAYFFQYSMGDVVEPPLALYRLLSAGRRRGGSATAQASFTSGPRTGCRYSIVATPPSPTLRRCTVPRPPRTRPAVIGNARPTRSSSGLPQPGIPAVRPKRCGQCSTGSAPSA